jgi:murein L,D-transpeptidase YcbB/YkuD
MIGHECVRMANPLQFAEALLAEDRLGTASGQKLSDKSVNHFVSIDRTILVHMTFSPLW